MAAADCNGLTLGVESAQYEGPLRVRVPVRLASSAAGDGGWSFEIPLPDPASQKLLSRWGCTGQGMLGDSREGLIADGRTAVTTTLRHLADLVLLPPPALHTLSLYGLSVKGAKLRKCIAAGM